MRSTLAAGLLLCATTMATVAAATEHGAPNSITDASVHTRQTDLSLLLWLPYYYGYGIGVEGRFEFPVVPDGFIPSINDEFSLEPSLGIASTRYSVSGGAVSIVNFAPALYGNWSFNFSTPFRAYVALGLGYNFASYPPGNYPGYGPAYFYWDLGLGIFYKFNRDVGFRAEIGSQGLKAGVAFYF
jgi:hypothetical protein